MIIGVPAESAPGERRVALIPESVQRLIAAGIDVRVEKGVGQLAWFSGEGYRRTGAKVESSTQSLYNGAAFIVKIRSPSLVEVERMQEKTTLVCLLYPHLHSDVMRRLALRGITTIVMENLPRTTAAQSMDVLSSQSTVAGYRAVIVAANALPKLFPLLMTPAGTVAPARVLVLGAGVAGLQAIATARRY